MLGRLFRKLLKVITFGFYDKSVVESPYAVMAEGLARNSLALKSNKKKARRPSYSST